MSLDWSSHKNADEIRILGHPVPGKILCMKEWTWEGGPGSSGEISSNRKQRITFDSKF